MIRYLRQPAVLRNLGTASNVTSTVIGTPFSVSNATQSTSTSTGAVIVSGGVGVTGNIYANKVFATQVNGLITTSSQPNITQIGVQPVFTAVDVTITGNLVLTGTPTTVSSVNTSVSDSLITLHTSGTTLTVDDGSDIGFKFNYFKSAVGSQQSAFVAWDNVTGH